MKDSFFIGVDIGGTSVKIGLLQNNVFIDKKVIPAQAKNGLEASLPIFKEEIDYLLLKNKAKEGLKSIGFAFPGLVNVDTKKIISTNKKYDDAPNIDLESWVKETYDVPFFIDNDARMAAVGEWKYGAGIGTNDLVMITIGTGIGTAAIMDGKLLRGKHHQAGCLGGHFTINLGGTKCNCGNIGCAEAEASTWSIKNKIKEDPTFNKSLLSQIDEVDFYHVFNAAKKEDSLAIKIKTEALIAWSTAIVNLIHAYDPEVVIMGGGILNSKDEIIPFITKKIEALAWTPWGKVAVKPSELMNDAAIYGLKYCSENL